MRTCNKCGSDDLIIIHREKGDNCGLTLKSISNKFIRSNSRAFDYWIEAKKEHLECICRTCQYKWQENTLDSKDDN